MIASNHADGAPGPSPLGTGEYGWVKLPNHSSPTSIRVPHPRRVFAFAARVGYHGLQLATRRVAILTFFHPLSHISFGCPVLTRFGRDRVAVSQTKYPVPNQTLSVPSQPAPNRALGTAKSLPHPLPIISLIRRTMCPCTSCAQSSVPVPVSTAQRQIRKTHRQKTVKR